MALEHTVVCFKVMGQCAMIEKWKDYDCVGERFAVIQITNLKDLRVRTSLVHMPEMLSPHRVLV
jgi:hypothetical protein